MTGGGLYGENAMKRYMDIIAGLAFLALAAALYVGSYSIRTFSDTGYGVTFLPRVTALVMAVVSLVVLAGGVKKLRTEPGGERFGVTPAFAATAALIFLYILSMEKLGFILSTIAYVALQIFILSEYNRKRLLFGAAIAVPFSFGVYYLFTRVIYIMLPAGILG